MMISCLSSTCYKKIEDGERDIREGRVLAHAHMKKALSKWLK